MSELRTDEETVEQIQNWWRENGTTLLVTVVLVFGGVFGWNWWQDQRQAEIEAASALYLQWMQGREEGESVDDLAARLREEHAGSPYVALLRFDAAAEAVAAQDLQTARKELETVLEMDLTAPLHDLARLRLARLDLDAGEPKAVLARLDPITGTDRIAAAQELRGDALRALDRLDEARAAYERAMAASSADRPLLEMKRDDLGASIAATRALETTE